MMWKVLSQQFDWALWINLEAYQTNPTILHQQVWPLNQSQRLICLHRNKERNVWITPSKNLIQPAAEKEINQMRILQSTKYHKCQAHGNITHWPCNSCWFYMTYDFGIRYVSRKNDMHLLDAFQYQSKMGID